MDIVMYHTSVYCNSPSFSVLPRVYVYLCMYIADILDRVSPKFHQLGLTYECLGGGRIDHDSAGKKIKIYGYSVVSIYHIHTQMKRTQMCNQLK